MFLPVKQRVFGTLSTTPELHWRCPSLFLWVWGADCGFRSPGSPPPNALREYLSLIFFCLCLCELVSLIFFCLCLCELVFVRQANTTTYRSKIFSPSLLNSQTPGERSTKRFAKRQQYKEFLEKIESKEVNKNNEDLDSAL